MYKARKNQMESSARDSVLGNMNGKKRQIKREVSDNVDNNNKVARIKKEPEEAFYRCAKCSKRVADASITLDGPLKEGKKTMLVACSEQCKASYQTSQCNHCKHHHPYPGKWLHKMDKSDCSWYCSAHCYLDAMETMKKAERKERKARRMESQMHEMSIKTEPIDVDGITGLDF